MEIKVWTPVTDVTRKQLGTWRKQTLAQKEVAQHNSQIQK